ncbi:MAG: amidase [Nocardioidaceae bacterium]
MTTDANATWLLRLETSGDGPRLAVKDCIDVAGTPTTVGCEAIALDAVPAASDAPVVAAARSQGARIVGKTNLVALCRYADGVNPWTGTPANPIDATRIPGGSSSGSAVAVAGDECDVAYGTDTGGSVRVPAACCGIAALKTTEQRIPTHGVFEFSRTLDTVGPMARDVEGLALGMRLMERGFTFAVHPDRVRVGRLRVAGVAADVDAAIDYALSAAGAGVTDIDVGVTEWESWIEAAGTIMDAEGWHAQRHLLTRADLLEARVARAIRDGADVDPQSVVAARRTSQNARAVMRRLLDAHGLLALPTLRTEPPRLDDRGARTTYLTVPFNLVGLPALSMPVPMPGSVFPASLQLVGGWYSEERLLGAAWQLESALARGAASRGD